MRRNIPNLEGGSTFALARNPTAKLGYQSCTGWYTSVKGRVRLPFESLLERDLMIVQDIDPDVVEFVAQPETFTWYEGRRQRCYTPDFRVVTVGGQVLFREVKPQAKLATDLSLKGRLPRIIEECAARGATHEFWTEVEIRQQPRFGNCGRIRAAVSFLTPANLTIVRSALAARLPTTLAAVREAVGPAPELVNAILGLVAIGELALDLDAIIGPHTELRRGRAA